MRQPAAGLVAPARVMLVGAGREDVITTFWRSPVTIWGAIGSEGSDSNVRGTPPPSKRPPGDGPLPRS